MPKYVFVTGGVVSSLGKGLTASSLGFLLRSRGLRVTIDPQAGLAVRRARGRPAVVFYTLVKPELRDAMRQLCRSARVHYCDLLGHPIDAVARVSGQAARMTPGARAPLNPASISVLHQWTCNNQRVEVRFRESEPFQIVPHQLEPVTATAGSHEHVSWDEGQVESWRKGPPFADVADVVGALQGFGREPVLRQGIVDLTRAVDEDQVVKLVYRLRDILLRPTLADPIGIVHHVPQAQNAQGARALLTQEPERRLDLLHRLTLVVGEPDTRQRDQIIH